jgi:AI-2 transport system substrate-binding protein
VGFFTSGGQRREEAGKRCGDVTYDGPTERVSGQVQLINNFVNQGYKLSSPPCRRMACPALKRAMQRGVKVLTWDPIQSRSAAASTSGHPGTARRPAGGYGQNRSPNRMPKSRSFYSSPTVTDQNQWVKERKAKIEKEHPQWQIVTTQFGYNDATKSLQTAEGILKAYPDLDAIAAGCQCPASGSAGGGNSEGVAIVGFSTPNVMPVRRARHGESLRPVGCGATGQNCVNVADHLLKKAILTWATAWSEDIGTLKVEPNSVQGYQYEAKGNGIVLLPERVVFTKENINQYDF